MKKTLVFVAIGLALLLLVACGQKATPAAKPAPTPAPTPVGTATSGSTSDATSQIDSQVAAVDTLDKDFDTSQFDDLDQSLGQIDNLDIS